MSKHPSAHAPSGPGASTGYTDATETVFRRALEQLAKALPAHHAALARLVDEGRFHDIDAVEAVLEGGAR